MCWLSVTLKLVIMRRTSLVHYFISLISCSDERKCDLELQQIEGEKSQRTAEKERAKPRLDRE